jgi:hypothetical protein
MSQLVLFCEKTGRLFNSGFEATSDDLRCVPRTLTAKFLCRACTTVHDFDFARAGICECPNKCPAFGDCQRCDFGKLPDKTAA